MYLFFSPSHCSEQVTVSFRLCASHSLPTYVMNHSIFLIFDIAVLRCPGILLAPIDVFVFFPLFFIFFVFAAGK